MRSTFALPNVQKTVRGPFMNKASLTNSNHEIEVALRMLKQEKANRMKQFYPTNLSSRKPSNNSTQETFAATNTFNTNNSKPTKFNNMAKKEAYIPVSKINTLAIASAENRQK